MLPPSLFARPVHRLALSRLVATRRTLIHAPLFQHLVQNDTLDNVFSEKGLDNAWNKRIDLYAKRLNQFEPQLFTSNNDHSFINIENLQNLMLKNSRNSDKYDMLIYCSLLHNLQFSISSLRNITSQKLDIKKSTSLLDYSPDIKTNNSLPNYFIPNSDNTNDPPIFVKAIDTFFGSIQEFKTLLLNSALSISGDGFTWLVARQKRSNDELTSDGLFILNTYNAGLPFNFYKAGHLNDIQTSLNQKKNTENNDNDTNINIQRRSVQDAQDFDRFDTEIVYNPLLAIDASPKAYLTDYGVFGKRDYLENIWNATNWQIVESRLPSLELGYQT